MKNPYLALLRTAWHYARHEKRRYVFVYCLFVLANIVAALHPLLFGWFIESIQRQNTQVMTMVWLYAGAFMGLKVLEWAFHGPARVMERQLAFVVSRNFLAELYHQTLHRPVSWHKEHHSGATINRIRKANEALKNFFQSGFIYLHTIAKCLFSFGAMLYFSPLFGAIGIGLGMVTVWVILQFDKPFIRTLEETNEREHEASSNLFDSLSNIISVITLRLEKRMEVAQLDKIAAIFPPFRRNVRINEVKWYVASMLIALIYVVVSVGYVWQHLPDATHGPGATFYVGSLVTLLGFVNQFTSVFSDVALQYTQIVQYNTDVQTAVQAIGLGADTKADDPLNAAATLPEQWQTIDIDKLSFTHRRTGNFFASTRQLPNLQDLQIRIRRGQRIAFIGESGSGKSTLLTLLRGLYPAEAGLELRVDGELHGDLNRVANTVTLFPQEPEIFEHSIAYNITLGLPFSEEEVMQVCQTAHFADVVGQLANGLDTKIQEKGVNLSGGQKQRLALARGVLAARHSDIILMDEPTSSIDPKTEFQIYHRLLQEFSDKAVLSTLHRLHLLPMFDYIYILRKGQIVDEGTFVSLRERSPIFQEMWHHQKEAMSEGVLV